MLSHRGNREDFKCVIENRWYSWRDAGMGYTLIKINIHCKHTHTHRLVYEDTQITADSQQHFLITAMWQEVLGAADLWHVLCHTETLSNEDRCDLAPDQMGLYSTNKVWHHQNQIREIIFYSGDKMRCPLNFSPLLSGLTTTHFFTLVSQNQIHSFYEPAWVFLMYFSVDRMTNLHCSHIKSMWHKMLRCTTI